MAMSFSSFADEQVSTLGKMINIRGSFVPVFVAMDSKGQGIVMQYSSELMAPDVYSAVSGCQKEAEENIVQLDFLVKNRPGFSVGEMEKSLEVINIKCLPSPEAVQAWKSLL
jgi:hypothetical protein